MHLTTLVSTLAVLAAFLPQNVWGQNYPTGASSTTRAPSSCPTVYTTDEVKCPKPTLGCVTLACLKLETLTVSCGCNGVATSKTCETACPTGCGATSYITAVEDCFPTYTPPPNYTNSTKTKTKTETETHIITLTTCPASVTCVGQTTTYTSTEACPTSTCTCILPSVTYTTTVLPGQTTTPKPASTSQTSAPPPPASTTRPSATFVPSSEAGQWHASVWAGVLGFLTIVVLGML